MLSLLSPSHLVMPHAPLRSLIYKTVTLDCCALFHIQVPDQYVIVGRRIVLFFNPLFTSMDTFLSLIVIASNPFTALSLISASISPCLHSNLPYSVHLSNAKFNQYLSSITLVNSRIHPLSVFPPTCDELFQKKSVKTPLMLN